MKKLVISLVIFLAAAVSVTLIAFSGTSENLAEAKLQQEKPKAESCCATDMDETASTNFSENSVYQVNSNWKNQFGNDVHIGDLKGKTQIFTMIFANCTYACPILANDMRRIEGALTKDELRNVQFTLISIDPDRDTPERLKEFADNQNLNLARFQLLTGKRSDIDDLAALTGFRYKEENDGSFSHSNIITILNKEGEIIHQQVGLNQDIQKTLEVIKNQTKLGV